MTAEYVIGLMLAFFVGVFVGKMAEAFLWRSTANDFLRRASGGRLFVVREDPGPSSTWDGRTSR